MRTKTRNLVLGVVFLLAAIAPATSRKPDRYGEITATLAELQTLCDAMVWVYIDIGYYVSIENLDDLLPDHIIHDYDNIDQFGGTWVIDTTTAHFHADRVDLTAPPHLWGGPYVTFQDNRISEDGAGYDRGTLLDLWGTPYYLFTPAGLVRPDSHTITHELYGDTFDTYAIVSLGPDGVKGSDDLIRTFGAPPTKIVLTSLSNEIAYPGNTINIRGYNFGSQQQDAVLFLGAAPITTITNWSDHEIDFTIPQDAQSGNLKIVRGEQDSNALHLTILELPTAAHNWMLYR